MLTEKTLTTAQKGRLKDGGLVFQVHLGDNAFRYCELEDSTLITPKFL